MRVIALFLLFISILSAQVAPIKSDFKACYNKNRSSFVWIKKRVGVAVDKDKVLLFSKRYLRGYIKRDPFLGLYLFRSKKSLKPVKFTDFSKVKKSVGIIGRKRYAIANILSFSNALETMAKIDKRAKANRLIECVCCRAFGLSAGGNDFIDSDFILRFLRQKRVVYADVGLKFVKKGSSIIVKEKNPFFKGLYLKKGDEILKIDGKRYSDLSTLGKYILFSKVGKIIHIVYKRGSKIYKQNIKLKRKIAGGLIPQTYLESIGLWIGHSLKIYRVDRNSLAKRLGLKKGDKLMKIGSHYIKSYKDIKKALLNTKDKTLYLLFSRDDFQFFVHFGR